MSSLWSMIRKGRTIRYDPDTFSTENADRIFPKVISSEPRLVNISVQADEWYHDPARRDIRFADFDATPCFPTLWMEWIWERRCGVLIHRVPATEDLTHYIQSTGRKMLTPLAGSRYLVQLLFFGEDEGYPNFHGVLDFYIDAMGHPLEGGFQTKAHPDDTGPITNIAFLVADVLTTINTIGTRIEPPFTEKRAQIVKPNRPPFSVWHTIHLPKFARPPLDGSALISPEILERREHWVRGHRKDYRSGNGMFGRIKALVWVPEFQRGNPELGSVRQTYTVAVAPRKEIP
jgi:hypothetical protein